MREDETHEASAALVAAGELQEVAQPSGLGSARLPALLNYMLHERRTADDVMRKLLDGAIREAHRYKDLHKLAWESDKEFGDRDVHQWDYFLSALDTYLEGAQRRHLRAVDDAGVSGRPKSDDL